MSCAEVWLHGHTGEHVVGCGRRGRICGGIRGRYQLGGGGITQIGSAADERHEESQKNQGVLHERKLLLNTGLGLAETGYFSERQYSRVRMSCKKLPTKFLR